MAIANPPPTGTPAASATPPVSKPGFVTLKIAGQEYTLTGFVGHSINVDYHAEFKDSFNLGTIGSIIGEVGTTLGVPDIATTYNGVVDELQGVDILKPVTQALTSANIRITDLGINTATKTYRFGFALDFTNSNVSVLGIQLEAFGILLTHTPKAAATA